MTPSTPSENEDEAIMTSIAARDNPDSLAAGRTRQFLPVDWLTAHWEILLYGLLFGLAVFTRFYDLGARAVSHDESLHMLYSYKLYNGEGYHHDPMMHGPFLFEINAFLYFLFGDSNYVGRVGVALFGVALVMLPYWFRPWLGKLGALAASAMILISPAITHYSRHLRHDIFNEVFTVLMFICLFRCLLAWREGDPERLKRWLYIGAAAVALSLTVMEIAYIHGFIGCTFIVVVMLAERLTAVQRRRLFWAALALMFVVGALVLWLAVGNAGAGPVDQSPELARQVIKGLQRAVSVVVGGDASEDMASKAAWKILQLLVLASGLVFAASSLGLSIVDRPTGSGKDQRFVTDSLLTQTVRSIPLRSIGVCILIGAVIFVVLYTTFFTNPYGVISGTWGGLSYWLSQQDVQRGSQPWYYYLMLLPLYEFLPLLLGLAGGIWYIGSRLRVTRLVADHRPADEEGTADRAVTSGEADNPLSNYFVGFLIYWVLDAIFIYSWAGEKMPWLTVHMSLPLIFLSAWTVERALSGLRGRCRDVWQRGGMLFAVLLPLVGTALIALLSVQPFQGKSLFDLRDTGHWIGAAVVAAILIYALVHYGRRLGGDAAGRVAFAVAAGVLALLTARSSWLVSFINYDDVSEYLFYAHGGPDVTVAMKQIEDISRRTVGDKLIKVAYDNESTWPLEWYFREYPNRAYYGESPSRQQMEAPIVIVGSPNESKVTPYLGDKYVRFDYRLVWWPLETYKDQTPSKIWHTYFVPELRTDDPAGEQMAWDRVRQNRRELWDVLFYHRHATPKNEWPYVHRFYMYVRKDVLNQLWDYHTGPALTDMPTEIYAAGQREIRALRAIGNHGAGAGQLAAPRAMAIGDDGLWYVADSGNNRVQVFDSEGNTVRMWGTSGTDVGQFQEPWGIAVDSASGRVYVADTWNHRVQVFDLEGTYLLSWGYFADTNGQTGRDPGGFWGPRDIALDSSGNVYVADTGNKRIEKFTAEGVYLTEFGGAGVIAGRFDEPTSLALGADGTIYVADAWNRRVQTFSADLTPLSQWPIESWESEAVVNKPYLRLDAQGNVYVSDPERYRILVFDNQGTFLMSFGQYGADTGAFALPLGMAFEPGGNLVVVDSDNNRLLEFAPPLETAKDK